MHQVDVALGIAEDERNDPQASRKGLIDSTVLIRGESEVAAKRTIGQRCRSRTRSPASSAHHSPMVPTAPAFETAAGSRGSAAIGAETIGWSIPSNSHAGVWVLIGIAPFLAPAAPVD